MLQIGETKNEKSDGKNQKQAKFLQLVSKTLLLQSLYQFFIHQSVV